MTNDVYAQLTGDEQPAFKDGAINVAALQDIEPQIEQVADDLSGADATLQQMPADISPVLRGFVDEAQDQIDGIQRGLQIYETSRPTCHLCSGRIEPATYLVVVPQPRRVVRRWRCGSECSSAAVRQGKMEVVDKGAVSSHFFPGNPRVPWDPVAKGPYYAEENAEDGFAWSNLHQDYRITGEDMMRSWVANGGQPVDGVISLDPVALQAAVAATGPIQSDLYGEINADNMISKLFFEGTTKTRQRRNSATRSTSSYSTR